MVSVLSIVSWAFFPRLSAGSREFFSLSYAAPRLGGSDLIPASALGTHVGGVFVKRFPPK